MDCGFTATGDRLNTDPRLLTMSPENVGGPTDALPLAPTSVAVDAVPAGAPGCSGSDQRGVPRPQGAACDVGAYELVQLAASATPITAVAGSPFSGAVASVADQAPGISASDLTATIAWGDGTTSAATPTAGATAGTFTVAGTHTWAAAGTYTVTVTATSKEGSVAHASETVTVAAPAPPTVSTTTPTVPATGSPAVLLSPPRVLGDSTASFAGTVTPDGLATTSYFEYGLDPRYTGATAVVYDQRTPSAAVGGDFSAHAVSGQVSGLLPNAL